MKDLVPDREPRRKRRARAAPVDPTDIIRGLERELEECRAGLLFRAQELECAKVALESRARTWQSIIDSIADGVVVADGDGSVLCCNPAARRVLGDGPSATEPLPLARAIRGEALDDFELFVAGSGAGGDARGVLISVNARPLRDPHGVLLGGVVVFRDVTEKKRLLDENREKAAALVAQNREIQEANRLKSEFLANMSHELRSPLNAILGFAELLHDGVGGPVSSKQREYLGEVLLSSRHLLRLVNDVLDLAKVEAGKLVTNPERHDLSTLVGEVVQVLRSLGVSKRLRLATEVDPAVGPVVIDGARLKQVLYNYVSNAIKFTPDEGRVTVRVRSHGADDFLIEVEDTGIGIRAEDVKRLFSEFEQLDQGAAKKHAGTGLGLALTKRLVETLKGTVGVRSEPGRGSVFFAVLPRIAEGIAEGAPPLDAAPASGSCAREARPGRRAASRDGTRILVVDDNKANLELVRVLLEAEGHSVRSATCADEVLATVAEFAPELVLMDLQLPGTDGLELTRRLKALPATRDVPVVALTAYAMKGDERKAFDAGCDGYLTKPIDTRSFAGMVLGYVPRRSSR